MLSWQIRKLVALMRNYSVFQLHEVYSRLCAQRQVSGVGQGECLSLCSLLESRGIVALKKAKEARLTKVPDASRGNALQCSVRPLLLKNETRGVIREQDTEWNVAD